MKTIAATILTLAMAVTTFAQGPGGRGGTPPTPEQMIERRIQMLTTLLTLDATQQQQAKTIFTNAATASQALREPSKAAHDALQAAVKGGASDGQLTSSRPRLVLSTDRQRQFTPNLNRSLGPC